MNKKLVEDNMNLVYFTISKYYPTYIHDEDIIQTGMVGLCQAAKRWDESKSTFSTFAVKCICNEINMEFRQRNKHKDVLSLDYEVDNDDGDKVPLIDLIVGEEDIGYVDLDSFIDKLSESQKQIYNLRRQGMSVMEIADRLGVSKQTVYKTLRKIKRLRG